MKRSLQAPPSLAEQADRDTDGPARLGDPASPFLRSDEAARFLRFEGPRARALFLKFANRHRIPVCRRGRVLLYERRVLEAFVRGQAWTKRRSA